MPSSNAICVEQASKCFLMYQKPADRLKQFVVPRLRRLMGRKPVAYYNEFWALRDIAFAVAQGETVGIIGRNGSGKSTLLQLICGILTPTGGHIRTSGRIAALLELGSGFNPEFTGRENVYLNATVLGLSTKEIKERYDDIVAFADIGEFVDHPVKTYSSGMVVRLAFAVIAHVDADILIIDEALAVGDVVFTQKCMRWLRNFQKSGTILFVSHDTGSVLNLCDRAVWLNQGRIERSGKAKDVVEAYLKYNFQQMSGDAISLESLEGDDAGEIAEEGTTPAIDYNSRMEVRDKLTAARGWKTGAAEITALELRRVDDSHQSHFVGNENVRLRIRAHTHEALDQPILGFLFRDRLGQDLFGENTLPATGANPIALEPGQDFEAVFEFRMPMLPNGDYEVMASVANGTLDNHIQHHWLHNALLVNVSSSEVRWGLVGIPFSHVSLKHVES